MKKMALLFFVLLTTRTTFSQNYRLIDPGREYFFESPAAGETSFSDAIRIDSTVQSGNELLLYNYKILDSLSGLPSPCLYDAARPGWLGEVIVEAAAGVYALLNRAGDTLTIATLTPLGGTFDLMDLGGGDRLEAEVVALNAGMVLGQADSIKVFELTARDGMNQAVTHPLNQKRFHIAKNMGLVQALRFYDLPNDPLELPIAGISNPDLGKVNLGLADIYNWEVGDTFQYLHFNDIYLMQWDSTFEEIAVLSKSVSPNNDTVRYEVFQRSWTHSYVYPNHSYSRSSGTLTKMFIIHGNQSPVMPQQFAQPNATFSYPALPSGFNFPTLFFDGDYNARTQKRYYNNWDVWSYGCPVPVPDGLPLSDYGDGLGLVYESYTFNNNYGYTQMCYFDKNGEKWGNRKDFDVLLAREAGQTAAGVAMKPNPASGRVSVVRTGNWAAQTGTLQVYELGGKEVIRRRLTTESQSEIDLQGLNSGIYLVRIVLGDGQVHLQKLVVQ